VRPRVFQKCAHCPRYYVRWQPGFHERHIEIQVTHEMGTCVAPPAFSLANDRARIGPTELFYGSLLLLILLHWMFA
jgi:hypothetical protein